MFDKRLNIMNNLIQNYELILKGLTNFYLFVLNRNINSIKGIFAKCTTVYLVFNAINITILVELC
ncbi:hypothetical protein EZS27_021314 [termite gut metagenome]|uniref:Uncharacterized protein n=1 Tax=termite gut metagenome TaxID=433724 RepID=A0A5J4R750_9ZZZZ